MSTVALRSQSPQATPCPFCSDALGHGRPPLMALVGYCNFAVIYRKSPVGLGVPGILERAKLGDNEERVNRFLQELAWEAVTQHPLSGVQAEGK